MSRGVLAWPVESEPSWPVVMAEIMSRASPARHSPTTMRSGRMCRALRSRSRMVISPRPSRLEGRASSETTWVWLSCSSAASSMVMMRSSSGMKEERTLRVVVFPEPVPPERKRFRRASTQARRKANISPVAVPKWTRSSTPNLVPNLRTVMTGPTSESGRMMAFTREPSGSRASTRGLVSSMWRPRGVRMRSMMLRTCSSSRKVMSTFSMRPARSM